MSERAQLIAFRIALLILLAGLLVTQILGVLTARQTVKMGAFREKNLSVAQYGQLVESLPVVVVHEIRRSVSVDGEVEVSGEVDVSGSTVACELDEPVTVMSY